MIPTHLLPRANPINNLNSDHNKMRLNRDGKENQWTIKTLVVLLISNNSVLNPNKIQTSLNHNKIFSISPVKTVKVLVAKTWLWQEQIFIGLLKLSKISTTDQLFPSNNSKKQWKPLTVSVFTSERWMTSSLQFNQPTLVRTCLCLTL